ncbi:MAG: ribonuclease III [Syntrophobacterales bacterium]|nr:ribonuclease III [Syntrophobacterales bacterium]
MTEKLEETIGYTFKNKNLLIEALTHRSFAYEQGNSTVKDNERLEFLGDAVLELAISHYLWHLYPHYTEGELSRLRSAIVREEELARLAERLHLGDYLILGKGEEHTGGRKKPSILSGAIEAVMGAIYLDGGWESVMRFVEANFLPFLEALSNKDPLRELDRDYKTKLQEWMQGNFKKTPTYRIDREEGPDHAKIFYVSVLMDGKVLARGKGRSKKEAQQKAARVAYMKLVRGTADNDPPQEESQDLL